MADATVEQRVAELERRVAQLETRGQPQIHCGRCGARMILGVTHVCDEDALTARRVG